MPRIRVETIGAIAFASVAASALTPERAMMKPMTVPIRPIRTMVLARCRMLPRRTPNFIFSASATRARLWLSLPAMARR